MSIQETFFFCEGLSLECYKTSHTGAGSDLVQCSEEEDTCIISGLSGNNKAKLADNRDKPRNLEFTCVHQKDQNPRPHLVFPILDLTFQDLGLGFKFGLWTRDWGLTILNF